MKKYIALFACAALMCGCSAADGDKLLMSEDISSAETIETIISEEASLSETTETVEETTEESTETTIETTETTTETTMESTMETTTETTAEIFTMADIPPVTEKAADRYKRYNLDEAVKNVRNVEMYDFDFLTDEQQDAFDKAYYIMHIFNKGDMFFWSSVNVEESSVGFIEGTSFHPTGFYYDSVMNEFSKVISIDLLTENYGNYFSNNDDEFALICGAAGGNRLFMEEKFELVKNDENELVFKVTAGYGEPDYGVVEYTEEYEFRAEKQDGNWVFTEFTMWK